MAGCPRGSSRTGGGPACRTQPVWPSDRLGQPFRRRAVGAVLVLRDAHDPRLLPLLLGHRRRPRAARRPPRPGIVGAYGGLVYLSTVLGGWIADRVLGMERTVFYGGVVVMCGHIALAIMPGLAGVAVGLVLVALGSGALKANASSLLGTLYEKGDAALRRRVHAVLSRHQPRRVHRPADHRPAADPRSDSTGASAPRRSGWRSASPSTSSSGGTSATHGRTVPNPLPRSAIGWVVGAGVVGRRRHRGGLRHRVWSSWPTCRR